MGEGEMKSDEDMREYARKFKPLLEGELCHQCKMPVSPTEDNIVIEYYAEKSSDPYPYESAYIYHWECKNS
jgi:hypothetical protein